MCKYLYDNHFENYLLTAVLWYLKYKYQIKSTLTVIHSLKYVNNCIFIDSCVGSRFNLPVSRFSHRAPSLYIYTYTHPYIPRVYIYHYIHTYLYVDSYHYTCICIHIHMHTYTQGYIPLYIPVYTYTCLYTCFCVYTYIHTIYTHTTDLFTVYTYTYMKYYLYDIIYILYRKLYVEREWKRENCFYSNKDWKAIGISLFYTRSLAFYVMYMYRDWNRRKITTVSGSFSSC